MERFIKPTKNPFFNFLQEYRTRPTNRYKSASESAVDGARLWNRMSGRQRKPYVEMAIPFKKQKQMAKSKLSPAVRMVVTNSAATRSRATSQPPAKKLKRTATSRVVKNRSKPLKSTKPETSRDVKKRTGKVETVPKSRKSKVYFGGMFKMEDDEFLDSEEEEPEFIEEMDQMPDQNIYKAGSGGKGVKGAKAPKPRPDAGKKKQQKKKPEKPDKAKRSDTDSPKAVKGSKSTKKGGGASRGPPSKGSPKAPAVVPEANAPPASTTPIAAPDVGMKGVKGSKGTKGIKGIKGAKGTKGAKAAAAAATASGTKAPETTHASPPASSITPAPPAAASPAAAAQPSGVTQPGSSSASPQATVPHATAPQAGVPQAAAPQSSTPLATSGYPPSVAAQQPSVGVPGPPTAVAHPTAVAATGQTTPCPPEPLCPTEATCPPQPECTELPTCPPECTSTCPPQPDCSEAPIPTECKSCRQPGNLVDPSVVEIDGDITVGSSSLNVLDTSRSSKKYKTSHRIKKIPPGTYLPSNNDSEISDSTSPQL